MSGWDRRHHAATNRVLPGSSIGCIKLYAVNTPKRGERGFTAAAERLEELADNEVWLITKSEDQYDRILACIYTAGGISIDNTL